MSVTCTLAWPTDVARLTAPGGLDNSWKMYTPSIALVGAAVARHAPAYFYIALQHLSLEQINAIVTDVDSIGNAVISASVSGVEASVGTLRNIAFACMALASGARSFVEIGSGYGAFALILDRVAVALQLVVTSFTLCDIASAIPLQASYLSNVQFQINYIALENNGGDFAPRTADMMFSAYALSELANKNTLINNILPQCNMLFWVWGSPDRTGIPADATTAPEYPATGKATLFVTRGFNLSSPL